MQQIMKLHCPVQTMLKFVNLRLVSCSDFPPVSSTGHIL